jgi:peroxiredoxin
MTQYFSKLPPNLPVPVNDGASDRLLGKNLPHVILASTSGNQINLADIQDKIVLYCYPMTGKPGVKLPADWDLIPGARGCTPQSCSFRDHYQELQALDAQVYGISTQETSAQDEQCSKFHLFLRMHRNMLKRLSCS